MQMDHRPPVEPHARMHSIGDRLHGGRVEVADLEDIKDKLFFDREDTSDPYVRFGVLLVLSVVIATGGVLTDSTATVIGAMIVAPLMTPIMATAVAVVIGDGSRILRSILTVAIGVATAIGLSWALAALSSSVITVSGNTQVAGRVSPRTSDLVVALASGAAGAFALSRANVSDALPGVAIAISLVPPLCVVGVMMANGDPDAAMGALLLFTTNLLAILVAGGGLLAIMGYGRAALGTVKSHERRRAALVIGAATLIVIVPLSATGIRVGRDSALEYTVTREVDQAIEGTQIELARVTSTHGKVEVVLAGDDQKDASFAEELAAELHRSHPEATVRVQLLQTKLTEIPAE